MSFRFVAWIETPQRRGVKDGLGCELIGGGPASAWWLIVPVISGSKGGLETFVCAIVISKETVSARRRSPLVRMPTNLLRRTGWFNQLPSGDSRRSSLPMPTENGPGVGLSLTCVHNFPINHSAGPFPTTIGLWLQIECSGAFGCLRRCSQMEPRSSRQHATLAPNPRALT
ncbi:hypothetical protein BJX96DRAFT_27749 [Aspergillus floccosus]